MSQHYKPAAANVTDNASVNPNKLIRESGYPEAFWVCLGQYGLKVRSSQRLNGSTLQIVLRGSVGKSEQAAKIELPIPPSADSAKDYRPALENAFSSIAKHNDAIRDTSAAARRLWAQRPQVAHDHQSRQRKKTHWHANDARPRG
jgi:hypothetical protein